MRSNLEIWHNLGQKTCRDALMPAELAKDRGPRLEIRVSDASRRLTFLSPFEVAICEKLLLSLSLIAITYAIVPALYSSSPIWAVGILLALVLKRGGKGAAVDKRNPPEEVDFAARWRVSTFLGLYALVIAAGIGLSHQFHSTRYDGVGGHWLAVGKLLVLAPALVLFNGRQRLKLLRIYPAELASFLVVLFTFFPFRLFRIIWPIYSDAITVLAYCLAKAMVHGLGYTLMPDPRIIGPRLDLEIVFACSGYAALSLFDVLIALVALIDWNELNPKRLLAAYAVGSAVILAANVVRISLLVVVGNLMNPQYALGRFHVDAGWVFFTIVYLIVLAISYCWVLRSPQTQ
jgi:exosortase/archaeosortase family protein